MGHTSSERIERLNKMLRTGLINVPIYGYKVFLASNIKILDAIEDITLDIAI